MKKDVINNIFIVILSCLLVLPSLLITRYVYPVQDDFHYAHVAMQHFMNGENLLTMAGKETVHYYLTFMGGYSSTFFGHLFSGIVLCDNIKIKIFCFLSLTFFYISIAVFSYTIAKVFNIPANKKIYLMFLLLILITGVIYYADHEDYYWFITSVQYLFLTSCMLMGVSAFIEGILLNKPLLLIFAIIGGVIGCGAALNIAFLTVALYFVTGCFLYLRLKKSKNILIVLSFITGGVLVNGLAPGNYIRDSGHLSIYRVIEAVVLSYKYTFIRIKGMLSGILFPAVLLILAVLLFSWKISVEEKRKFRFPLLACLILFSIIPFVIFPVMLGYGWDCYLIICRGNFISDLTIYIISFLILFYVRNWAAEKYPDFCIMGNKGKYCIALITIGTCLFLNTQYCKGTAFWREVTELRNGRIKNYYSYVRGVYRDVENSEDDIVVIYRKPVEDKTLLMNPYFAYGDYDINKFMARFYGKKQIVLYQDEAD